MYSSLSIYLALRFTLSGRQHRFASLVAALSCLGIAIGVAALITVSAVMQGLHDNLKAAALTSVPHVTVEASPEAIPELLKFPEVAAAAPYLESKALLQTGSSLTLVNLQGVDQAALVQKPNAPAGLFPFQPELHFGMYEIVTDLGLNAQYDLAVGFKVRLISTVNARYTPMGLTPTQRLFSVTGFRRSMSAGGDYYVETAFDDCRRFMKATPEDIRVRLWLRDPYDASAIAERLAEAGFSFHDWRETRGEFFRAVAMEKLSMSVMLFLIVIVAAFNILSALAMMVSARLTDIAVLRTLGMTSGGILRVFMLSGLGCGTLGTIIGCALGIPLAMNAGSVMRLLGFDITGGSQVPSSISALNLLLIAGGCMLMTLLCTVYPALRAASADPAANLVRS